jgi:gamma-glutamyltranspeptidase/glutathione hydrolase
VRRVDGAVVGGVQSILFTPDTAGAEIEPGQTEKRVNGFYRAASDFRKDGQAVGW